MLSISPSRIREIHDPCSLILMQLHKILFISQLPPSLEGDLLAERQVIDKYKRELFSHRNLYRGRNLKDELHKVMSGSHDTIEMAFRSHAAAGSDGAGHGAGDSDGGSFGGGFGAAKQRMSYEELQRAIEHVLEQTGYYDVRAAAEAPAALPPSHRPPHAPIPEPPAVERAASLPAPVPTSARAGHGGGAHGISTPRSGLGKAAAVAGGNGFVLPAPSPLGAGATLPPVRGQGSRGSLHAPGPAPAALPPSVEATPPPPRAPIRERDLPLAT